MGLKDWLGNLQGAKKGKKGPGGGPEHRTVSDLINLGRHEEALGRLEEQVKRRPNDHHARLKLAELKMEVGQRAEAVDEFLRVSEGYEKDGFYRKATALVTKVSRMLPHDERVQAKMRRLERISRLDHLREVVLECLPRSRSMKVEQLWSEVVRSKLLGRLSEPQLRRLLPNFRLRQFRADEEYVTAGVRQDELVWVVDGEICARVVLPTGAQTDIRCFGTGDLIGERALFSRQPWPAIYVASRGTTTLVLDRSGLEKSLAGEEDPRAFLEALRAERNDEGVAAAVAAMHRSDKEE